MLGNKALLPLLWSMYPNHPNLLPAYFSDPKTELSQEAYEALGVSKWVSKPLFGREGYGVFFSNNFTSYEEFVQTTENNFGTSNNVKLGNSIYQAESDLATAQGRAIQTSSWVVAGEPSGLAFREGKKGEHFQDSNPFLVHMVKGEDKKL